MIETRRLKNVVFFIQTILSFVLSRKIQEVVLTKVSKLNCLSNKKSTTNLFQEKDPFLEK